MKRFSGYYWVQWGSSEWTVGEWVDFGNWGSWSIMGWDGGVEEDELKIGPYIGRSPDDTKKQH